MKAKIQILILTLTCFLCGLANASNPTHSPTESSVYTEYNNEGKPQTITKPDGIIITCTYTQLGQPKKIYASDTSFDYNFIYDGMGNLLAIEDLVHHTTSSRKYNPSRQIIKETLANGLQISSFHDINHRRTRLQLPDGSAIDYEYDSEALCRITRLSKNLVDLYSQTYPKKNLQDNNVEMQLIGNAGLLSLSYDSLGRCRSIHSPHWSQEIPDEGIDISGNITSMQFNDIIGTSICSYTYDSNNRLISENDGSLHTYAYDARSNMILRDSSTLSINDQDQLTTTGDGAQYTYDLNGNMTSKSTNGKTSLYRYDALDRLISVEKPNEILVNYTYDVFHRRLSKSTSTWNSSSNQWENPQTIRFIFDGEKEIGAVDNNGNITQLRVLGLGAMDSGKSSEIGAAIAIELDGTVYAPIHDHRGNVSCLINAQTGEAAEFYKYSAFGTASVISPTKEVLQTSTIGNPWMFSSKRYDSESNLIYYGKRYYDPSTARWITKDPSGEIDGPNPYVFLRQSPLSSIDLYGLFTWSSTWNAVTSWVSSAASYLADIKHKVSFSDHIQLEWDRFAHSVIDRGFLQFSGYYQHSPESGHTNYGEEINDNVRISFINGILNVKDDLDNSLRFFSRTHGDTPIHYVFRPTEGWSKDIMYSILSKFGYTSPYAVLLAKKWKELIVELGGTESGGIIIHYSHSIGTADTYMAKNLLTPDEQRMIHVYSIGSPSMIPNNTGFGSTVNFVSRRDGVCLLDPIGLIKGMIEHDSNIEYLGSYWGIPLVDHLLFTDSYGGAIKKLGEEFVETYGH